MTASVWRLTGRVTGMSQSRVWPSHGSEEAEQASLSPVLLSSLTKVVTTSLCFSNRCCQGGFNESEADRDLSRLPRTTFLPVSHTYSVELLCVRGLGLKDTDPLHQVCLSPCPQLETGPSTKTSKILILY